LGKILSQSLFDAANGQLFAVGADGTVTTVSGSATATLPIQDVATLAAIGSFLVAGRDDGSIGLLSASGTLLAVEPTGFTDEPSALEVLQNGNNLTVFATQRGGDLPIIVSFVLPVVPELPTAAAIAEATSLGPATLAANTGPGGTDLLLVATLLIGGRVDSVSVNNTATSLELAELDVYASGSPYDTETITLVITALPIVTNPAQAPSETMDWLGFSSGAMEALRKRMERQQRTESIRTIFQVIEGMMQRLHGFLQTSAVTSDAPPELVPVAPPVDATAGEILESHGALVTTLVVGCMGVFLIVEPRRARDSR
jgi:hypothetical protein